MQDKNELSVIVRDYSDSYLLRILKINFVLLFGLLSTRLIAQDIEVGPLSSEVAVKLAGGKLNVSQMVSSGYKVAQEEIEQKQAEVELLRSKYENADQAKRYQRKQPIDVFELDGRISFRTPRARADYLEKVEFDIVRAEAEIRALPQWQMPPSRHGSDLYATIHRSSKGSVIYCDTEIEIFQHVEVTLSLGWLPDLNADINRTVAIWRAKRETQAPGPMLLKGFFLVTAPYEYESKLGTRTVDSIALIEPAIARAAIYELVSEDDRLYPVVGEVESWTDSTGKFKTIAILEKFDADSVHLRKMGGAIVEVPISRLGDVEKLRLQNTH